MKLVIYVPELSTRGYLLDVRQDTHGGLFVTGVSRDGVPLPKQEEYEVRGFAICAIAAGEYTRVST